MITYLIVAFGSALIAGVIGDLRGLTGCLFFFLAFLIGPLAIVAALIAAPDPKTEVKDGLRRGTLLRCPYCIEPIHREASICPHCRGAVIPTPAPPTLMENLGRLMGGTSRGPYG